MNTDTANLFITCIRLFILSSCCFLCVFSGGSVFRQYETLLAACFFFLPYNHLIPLMMMVMQIRMQFSLQQAAAMAHRRPEKMIPISFSGLAAGVIVTYQTADLCAVCTLSFVRFTITCL